MDARLRIVQMLMSTPAFDSVPQVRKSVETSLDAADTSVRATSVGGLSDMTAKINGLVCLLCWSRACQPDTHQHFCLVVSAQYRESFGILPPNIVITHGDVSRRCCW